VDKACKSNDLNFEIISMDLGSGKRVSNTLVRTSKSGIARRKTG